MEGDRVTVIGGGENEGFLGIGAVHGVRDGILVSHTVLEPEGSRIRLFEKGKRLTRAT